MGRFSRTGPAVDPLFCSYRNTSDRMLIVRCCGPQDFFLERVVFPFELLSFACPPDSDVEIWTHGSQGAELAETFPAESLEMVGAPRSARPDWLPELTPRPLGVRGNASTVCLDPF